jgi:hypothetical protein
MKKILNLMLTLGVLLILLVGCPPTKFREEKLTDQMIVLGAVSMKSKTAITSRQNREGARAALLVEARKQLHLDRVDSVVNVDITELRGTDGTWFILSGIAINYK